MNAMRYSHHSSQVRRPSTAKGSGGSGKRRRRKGGFRRIVRKNRKLIFIIGAALLISGAAAAVIFTVVLPAAAPVQETQAVSYFGDGDELDPSYYTDARKAATAGASTVGTASAAQVSELIGVVTEGGDTQSQQLILQKIEEAASAAMDDNRIEGVRFYDSTDANQQIQDVRSLINAGAKALIFDVSDIDVFKVITGLAHDVGIPVVAINAPMDAGYTVNIRTDNDQYGVASAQFIAGKLSSGSYVTVVATDDAAETVRIDNIKKMMPSGMNQAASKSSATAFGEYIETNAMPQAVVTAGCAYDTVYQMINDQKFPQVVAGEATAGFLRLMDKLRTVGVDIEIMPDMGEGDDPLLDPNATDTDATMQIQIVNVKAESMKFAAESGPAGVGGFALECALRLASGMTPREQAFPDGCCDFDACVLITGDELTAQIDRIKDMPDDYVIALWPSGSEIDAMFETKQGEAQ